jgi:hypothetical protein
MSALRDPIGSSFDDIVIGHRRLGVGHSVAALAVVLGLWLRIGPQYFAAALTFRIGGILAFGTAAAWFPILFSWLMAKQFIFGRRQARNYLFCLGLVATASAVAYTGKVGPAIPVYAVSLIATFVLGLSLAFCAVFAATSSSNTSLERTPER